MKQAQEIKKIPMLFSTPMVIAADKGLKTVTRRIVKPQINCEHSIFVAADWKDEPFTPSKYGLEKGYLYCGLCGNGVTLGSEGLKCPYGQEGDVIWVRESWGTQRNDVEIGEFFYCYKADDETYIPKWKPSIHMPREAARLFLRRTAGLKVERVSEISDEDCIAEGILFQDDNLFGGERRYKDYLADASGYGDPEHDFPTVSSPRESFRSLWQMINGKPSPVQTKIDGKLKTVGYVVYPFDAEAGKEFEGKTIWKGKPLIVVVDPYVWCVPFEKIQKP